MRSISAMTSPAPQHALNFVATTPLARLQAIRDYANVVFDDETMAATWLSRAHRAIRNGLSSAGAACQGEEGFREAVAELSRLERLSHEEVQNEVRGRRHSQ